MRGFVGGFLALMLLRAVMSSEAAAYRAGSAFTAAAGVFDRLVDPHVPLIPPKGASTSSGASTSGGATAQTVSTSSSPPANPFASAPGVQFYT